MKSLETARKFQTLSLRLTFLTLITLTAVGAARKKVSCSSRHGHLRCVNGIDPHYIHSRFQYVHVTLINCSSFYLSELRRLAGGRVQTVTLEGSDYVFPRINSHKSFEAITAHGMRCDFNRAISGLDRLKSTRKLNVSCPSLSERSISSAPLSPSAMVSLKELYLVNSNVVSTNPGVLTRASLLERLSLSKNRLEDFPRMVRSHMTLYHSLKRLDLSQNRISSFAASRMPDSCSLEHINLASNNLIEVPTQLFERCDELKSIDLSNNRNLKSLGSLGVFSGKALNLKLINTCVGEVAGGDDINTRLWSVDITSPCLGCDCAVDRLVKEHTSLDGYCTYESTPYFFNDFDRMKALWGVIGCQLQRPPCHCEAQPIDTPCTLKESQDASGAIASVDVTCSTSKVFPRAKCLFYRTVQATAFPLNHNDSDISYRYTHTGGNIFNTECSLSVPVNISKLGLGTFGFYAKMYPDVDGGINFAVDAPPAELILSLPESEIRLPNETATKTECIHIYIKETSAVSAICAPDEENPGKPRGQGRWFWLNGTQVSNQGTGETGVHVFSANSSHLDPVCKAVSSLGISAPKSFTFRFASDYATEKAKQLLDQTSGSSGTENDLVSMLIEEYGRRLYYMETEHNSRMENLELQKKVVEKQLELMSNATFNSP